MSENTRMGDEARPNTNGRNGVDPFADVADADGGQPTRQLAEAPDQADAATAFPIEMVFHSLGAEPGDEIASYVTDRSTWESLRAWAAQQGISIVAPNAVTEREGTTFEELGAVPASVAVMLSPDLCGTTKADVAEFIAESVLYGDISDPEAELAQRASEIDARKRERSQRQQRLKKVSVPPHTPYGLTEVERCCGPDVADAARQMIEQQNADTWNMGAAARKKRREEHPYLVTAAELVGLLGVDPDAVKALRPATASEISAALEQMASARRAHLQRIDRKARSLATPRQALTEVIRHVADMVNDEPTGTIVDGLIYEQTVIHWVGDGGTYKTFTVLALACSVAAGQDFTHRLRVPEKQPVLYLCAERRHYGLGADVQAWCQRNGFDISGLELAGWDDVVQLADDEWMAELTDYVLAQGIKLIVFDTQRKATRGLEENSATDMSVALANAQALAMKANAAVIVIHHTTRGQDHARGSSVGRDDTDATVVQKATGPNEGEFTIDKHKSEATGTRYPIKVETVTGTVPPSETRAGYSYTTMVASARDPLSANEATAKVQAALGHDDKILVAVVNDNDGSALSPAEVHRRAEARGCDLKKDAVRDHLRRLAKPTYGCMVEVVNPLTDRRTYLPQGSASAPADGGSDAPEATVVDLATRRGGSGSAAPSIPPAAQ